MKRLWIIVVVAMIAGSCNNEKITDKTFEVNATVEQYVFLTRSNEAMLGDVISVSTTGEEFVMGLSLFGVPDCSIYSVYDNTEEASRYRQLQSKFADNNPTKTIYRYYKNSNVNNGWRVESGDCIYTCFSDKINKIVITSSHAWDDAHPAGKELNELFTVEFSSLYDYTQRGFTGTPASQYRQVLSDVDASHYALLVLGTNERPLDTENMKFTTSVVPSDYKNHTITVTLTLDTGEVIAYTKKL